MKIKRYLSLILIFLFFGKNFVWSEEPKGFYIDEEQCTFRDFQDWHIPFFDVELKDDAVLTLHFRYCDFQRARIDYWDGFEVDWKTCKFTDTWLGGGGIRNIPQEILVKTRNFKEKKFPLSICNAALKDLNLTDFEFSNGNFSTLDVSGSCMKNAIFRNCTAPEMTEEQWQQTWNYATGDFRQISLPQNGCKTALNFARTLWGGCSDDENHRKRIPVLRFGPDVDLTDSVFIDCDLSQSSGLTLEQVKTTWNYKAGRMNLSQWPDYIMKALEEEK